jgi:chromosome partitioning protein
MTREENAMRKIALVNQKGGCGKTTTAVNLASCLAGKGRKVLLIDLDPQGHAGLALGVKPDQIEESIYEVLSGKMPSSEAIKTLGKNLDAIFSNVVLSAFEQVMAGVPEREFRLAEGLRDIEEDYEYLIIDCPPSVGLLTFNALIACDEAIIPVDSSSFSVNGLGKLLETIQLIEEQAGHGLTFRILATNIDRRTNFSNRVVETLKARFPKNCFKTGINTCTRLREAAAAGKPISGYDKYSAAFRDYQLLMKEILREEAKMKAKGFALKSFVEAKEKVEASMGKEVAFIIEAPENARVQIAGDFNSWMPESLHLTHSHGRPVWQKAIRLSPGLYQYKYLVDGRWVPDPTNKKAADDFFGGTNSVISV